MDYDEASDTNDTAKIRTALEKIELSANHLCLPAILFCRHIYSSGNNIKFEVFSKKEEIYLDKSNHQRYYNASHYIQKLINDTPVLPGDSVKNNQINPNSTTPFTEIDKAETSMLLLYSNQHRDTYKTLIDNFYAKVCELHRGSLAVNLILFMSSTAVLLPSIDSLISGHYDFIPIASTILTAPLVLYYGMLMLQPGVLSADTKTYLMNQVTLIALYIMITTSKNDNFEKSIIRKRESVIDIFNQNLNTMNAIKMIRRRIAKFLKSTPTTLYNDPHKLDHLSKESFDLI